MRPACSAANCPWRVDAQEEPSPPYGELVFDTGGIVGGLLAGGFLLLGSGLLIALLGGYLAGIAALVDVARRPSGAFGPWWDNTKSAWTIGIAVAFSLPFGPLVVALLWFGGGRRPLRWGRYAGRPFWVGPPRPYPPPPPAGHAEPAPRWDATRTGPPERNPRLARTRPVRPCRGRRRRGPVILPRRSDPARR